MLKLSCMSDWERISKTKVVIWELKPIDNSKNMNLLFALDFNTVCNEVAYNAWPHQNNTSH